MSLERLTLEEPSTEGPPPQHEQEESSVSVSGVDLLAKAETVSATSTSSSNCSEEQADPEESDEVVNDQKEQPPQPPPPQQLPKRKSSARRRISFDEAVLVNEFPVILGDHPATFQGPPVMLDWQAQGSYKIELDDKQESISTLGAGSGEMGLPPVDDPLKDPNPPPPRRKRTPMEFKMPASVREDLLLKSHSSGELGGESSSPEAEVSPITKAEMRRAAAEARKLRSRRQMSTAMVEIEGVEIFLASLKRKVVRGWRKLTKRQDSNDPAEAWLKEYYETARLEKFEPIDEFSHHSHGSTHVDEDLIMKNTRRNSKRILKDSSTKALNASQKNLNRGSSMPIISDSSTLILTDDEDSNHSR